MSRHERILLDGPDGRIEVFVEPPPEGDASTGIALIAHPHPLFGGTADNKVVTTLARTFRELGCATLRPNFRGVGGSEGEHDHGSAETTDLLAVHDHARMRFGTALPVYLAGFSFGAYVVTRLARQLAEQGTAATRLVLVGTAAGTIGPPRSQTPLAAPHRGADAVLGRPDDGMAEGLRRYETAAVPADTIVIHGAEDGTVPLANVLAWAKPLNLPVTVVPGADHFFHRRLHLIRDIIQRQWN
jgi:alpha/beta superfamily hydrolase